MIAFPEPVVKATAPKLPPLSTLERRIRTAILTALDRIQGEARYGDIRDALDRGDVEAAVEAVRIELGEAFLRSAIPQALRQAYEIEGDDVATVLGYSFDILTPQAVDWVRQNAGSLIRQWGDSSRDAIRNLIAESFRLNVPVGTLARQIRQTGIGLTWRQARAVLNMRQRLMADGLDAAKVDARAERYFKRLARYRAELIARTEMARASEHARHEAWRQGIAEGLIDPSRTEQEWVATHDHRACDDCLDLDGTRASIPDGHFVSATGTDGGLGPPRHPSCRCRATAVAVGSKPLPRAQPNEPLRKYNPNHVPAGSPEGGRFASGGGTAGSVPGDLGRQMDSDLAAARAAMELEQPMTRPALTGEEQAAITRFEADPNFSHIAGVPVERGPGQSIIEGQLTDAHLPQSHTDQLQAVRIPAGEWIAADRSPTGTAAGVYTPETREIHLAINAPGGGNIQVIGGATVLHEVGHHVHLARLTGEAADRWAVYSQRGIAARISAYARTNQGEHFAEAYRAYARGGRYRASLKALEPQAYAFMKDLFRPSGSKALLPIGRTAWIPGGWISRYEGGGSA